MVTVVILTVVTVVIVTSICKKQLDTLTIDETFSVQLFAIFAMFLFGISALIHTRREIQCLQYVEFFP